MDIEVLLVLILLGLSMWLGVLVAQLGLGTFDQGYSTAICEQKNLDWDTQNSHGLKQIVCKEKISQLSNCERIDSTDNYACVK